MGVLLSSIINFAIAGVRYPESATIVLILGLEVVIC